MATARPSSNINIATDDLESQYHSMVEAQQRRIVYFLGAGASYGAGATAPVQGSGEVKIPTQETFWATFLRFCKSAKNRNKIESFLFRYFLGYGKAPGRSSRMVRRTQLKHVDVEEVFTFLSERNNAPNTSPQFQRYTKEVWEALVEEIGQVFLRFEPNKKTRNVYRIFLKQHVRSRDTIASFNYDAVFEHSVPASFRWYYEVIHSDHKNSAIRVLKPHGSINWGESNGQILSYRTFDTFPARPVIIAPTHLKFIGTGTQNGSTDDLALHSKIGYLNQAPEIAKIWAAMEREMREAKALVFIGYSFPPSDLYFSSILRSVLAVRKYNPYIVLVNPDAMAIKNRLHTRFSIEKSEIQTFTDLQTFNQIGRTQVLRLFESA